MNYAVKKLEVNGLPRYELVPVPDGRAEGRMLRNVLVGIAIAVALLVASFVWGCASVALGNDPVIVRAEQALSGADVLYAHGMAYYFTPGVAATMSPGVVKVFEAVRTGYDAPYKAAQGALDIYKMARSLPPAQAATALPGAKASLSAKLGDLASAVNPLVPYVAGAKAVEGGLP